MGQVIVDLATADLAINKLSDNQYKRGGRMTGIELKILFDLADKRNKTTPHENDFVTNLLLHDVSSVLSSMDQANVHELHTKYVKK